MKERQLQALNSFAERVKKDSNVVALLLYGSLAYGTVWEKSDIDVELIVRDGTTVLSKWCWCFEEDGAEFELMRIEELSKFKNGLQHVRGGFDHGKYGEGTLVFSKDEALIDLFEGARKIGEDDAPRSFAARIGELLNWMNKAEKQVKVLHNPLYAQRFLQLCAPVVADMELLRHKENPTRESIIRAQQLNPDLMHEIYVIPSTTAMSESDVSRTLKILDDYLLQHMGWWSKHVLKFLGDGEMKTSSHIWKQCGGMPLEYLAEKGVLIKASMPTHLFKHSKLTVEETAYFYLKEEF